MKRVLCLRPRCQPRPAPGNARDDWLAWADWCQRFSPTVGFDNPRQPSSLLLDTTDTARHFGGENGLCRQILEPFQQQAGPVHLALADTVGAAWALAHYRRSATESSVQGALAVIQPPSTEALRALLAELPIAALRLPPQVLVWLHELGIRLIGQMERLPRQALATRFGSQLLHRWDQALGRMPEVIVACRQPPRLQLDQALEYPLGNHALLREALESLLARLTSEAARQQQGITQLRCRLRDESGHDCEAAVSLYRPTTQAHYLAELILLRLERTARPRPVVSIHLAITATDRLVCRQPPLFAEMRPAADPRQLALLIDRLAGRLGSDAVLRPRLVADSQPELACRFESLVEPPAKRAAVPPRVLAGQRPLWLARQPLPLEVMSVVPLGPPLWFRTTGREHRIARSWGPERIETGWWRGRDVRRDYYQVETLSGHRYWLFRRLADQRWFLHGWFE